MKVTERWKTVRWRRGESCGANFEIDRGLRKKRDEACTDALDTRLLFA